MIVILPPSETKKNGGAHDAVLDLGALSFLEVSDQRRAVLLGLQALCSDPVAARSALGLGPRQSHELERNRIISSAPTMPAIERYTGVLFDALDVVSLDHRARLWLNDSVLVHSALFGLLRCTDAIPAYRLSHDSQLPGLSLVALWRTALSKVLAEQEGLLLDLRSAAYAKLGPLSTRDNSYTLRVVAHTTDGTKKAVTHFNKAGKGALVRALANGGIDHEDVESLLSWAEDTGVALHCGALGELELAV